MKQEDTSTAAPLEAQYAIQSLKIDAKLRREAEGRFGWRGVVRFLLPLVFIVAGIAQRIEEGGISGLFSGSSAAWYMLSGVALLAITVWANTQIQLKAMLELLRRLERNRS